MRQLSLSLLSGALLTASTMLLPSSAALAATAPTAPDTSPVATTPLADTATTTARIVELTNAERAKAGLAPLTVNPNLSQAAQGYVEILKGGPCLDHTCGPVPDPGERLKNAGYTGATAWGENLAGGLTAPEAVVAEWMASPHHRENILNPNFRDIGIGVATGGQYGVYWAQEFGARGYALQADAPTTLRSSPSVAPPSAAVPLGAVVWTRGYPEIGPSGCVDYVAQWSDGTYSGTPWECGPGTIARRGTLMASRGYPQMAANGCIEYVTQWSDSTYTWVPFSCPAGVIYFKP